MRCVYCNDHVVGKPDVVVVQGKGPAHELCFQRSLADMNKRQFAGLDLSNLRESTLRELLDMVTMELNTRSANDEDMVELFD